MCVILNIEHACDVNLNSRATQNNKLSFLIKKSTKLQNIVRLCSQTNKSDEKVKFMFEYSYALGKNKNKIDRFYVFVCVVH